MCLAIPGRLLSIDGDEGTIDYGGLTPRAGLCLVPDARPGGRGLVHAGFVIAVLDPEEGRALEALAEETRLFAPQRPSLPGGEGHG